MLFKNIFGLKNELKELDSKLSNKVCCFTGHRPQSLPWRFNEQDERCIRMKNELKEEIIKAIKNGYTTFISGMALGFDMICAEIRCIYDDYIGPKCMFERNQYMINNSSLVIALFNGKNGGTKKTLDYAKSLNKPIIVIDLLLFK